MAWCGTQSRRECSFFSALGIIGPLLGQVDFTVEQALEAGDAIAEMHTDDAVINLAATAQPLPCDANGLVAALGRARFIDAADCFRMVVFACHHLLTLVANGLLIPLD